MHLSWTVVQGPFDSFLVQYKDKDGQLQTVPVAADQQEVTIEGLQPGRKYKFLLFGLTGEKRLGPISALGVTGEAVIPGLKTKELTGVDRREGGRPARSREERVCVLQPVTFLPEAISSSVGNRNPLLSSF